MSRAEQLAEALNGGRPLPLPWNEDLAKRLEFVAKKLREKPEESLTLWHLAGACQEALSFVVCASPEHHPVEEQADKASDEAEKAAEIISSKPW